MSPFNSEQSDFMVVPYSRRQFFDILSSVVVSIFLIVFIFQTLLIIVKRYRAENNGEKRNGNEN